MSHTATIKCDTNKIKSISAEIPSSAQNPLSAQSNEDINVANTILITKKRKNKLDEIDLT